ncbi:hypothetical protein TRFO_15565 [Tritrichomonas foetus]|uniref:Ubiquitin-like domain-containing protein n=1 Tax=Tritrichomonas foetus TaxID=1144522 RepID=A0A1J4KWI2_9EUKA|nr:hypothetical protein TRFO_15565 [Tritrichomonas foetus]|eukprot:OHT14062.1 hypothetical protein TRFO_15565 [Tritrichomonas foetus]
MIRITVFLPEVTLRREMRVSTTMLVDNLKKYIPMQSSADGKSSSNNISKNDISIIFRGSLLTQNMPLSFYSIGDGDILIAFTSSYTKKTDAQLWMHMTADYETFTERMKVTMNPRLAGALAHIRDVRMLRLSERPGMCSKLKRIYVGNGNACVKASIQPLNIEPSPAAAEPSCDPLPTLWYDEAAMSHTSGTNLQPVFC